MYTLLVVDDEDIIRQGIRSTIDGAELGFQTLEAENGVLALEQMMHQKVDAMILDVKMPKMDGITLLKELKKQKRSVLTILLTGYEEFDYAKTAMECGAVNYLLKPVMPDEIIKYAKDIRKMLDERSQHEEEFKQLKVHFEQNIQFMREKIWQDILSEDEQKEKLRERAEVLKLNLEGPFYQVAMLCVQKYKYYSQEETIQLINYAIGVSLKKKIKTEPCIELFQMGSSRYVMLFNTAEVTDSPLIDWLYDVKSSLEREHDVCCAIGVGERCSEIGEIRRSYREARYALRYLNLTECDYVIGSGALEEKNISKEYHFDYDSFSLRLKSAEKGLALQMLDELFEKIRKEEDDKFDLEGFYLIAAQIIFLMYQSFQQAGGERNQLKRTAIMVVNQLYNEDRMELLKKLLEDLVVEIVEEISKIKSDGRNSMIQKIKQIINEDYAKQLSLKYIADKLYLNHIYLGQIFKRETNITINDYINKVRISKAKKLLKTSAMVYEVAEQVGFKDAQYFSTVFKKQVGISPKEYKEI